MTPILENSSTVASLIDHTLLKPEATESDIARLCAEARQWGFASVCVNPCWVVSASDALRGSTVKVCTVIGFPLGANVTQIKLAEAGPALDQGALELDMVQNIGALRSGKFEIVGEEIHNLATLAHARGALLKVILETCLLSHEQKITACRLAVDAGADFVKTSTGFSSAGATVADIGLMRKTVGPTVGVKASGGVRTLAALRQMVTAGATRIGTSSGVAIIGELEAEARTGTAY
ncbi:MAG: deoxyribose-phosphate aldolase [Acidobacteriota bacterium]|nr:deoxyribose-phosphate aldolase [Acidobacteriota bacterium]